MGVQLVSVEGTQVKIEITIDLSRSMLTSEENIQKSLNEAGNMATGEALKYLDTDGSQIEIAGERMYCKAKQNKSYQTPYGKVEVKRHVYQKGGGGKTYCPMDREARIIIASTPFLAKQVSSKLAYGSGYLGAVAVALYPKDLGSQKRWLKESCHQLKHEEGAADLLYQQMLELCQSQKHSKGIKEKLEAAVTYFGNHRHQMNYAFYQQQCYPIGSGVTEAACQTVIKQRLCCSGMRWKETGAAVVLSLRTLVLTPTRWSQFWNKLNQYGFPTLSSL